MSTCPRPRRCGTIEAALARKKQSNVAGARIPCFLELEDESTFAHQGVIDFVDNQVDINTGTVQIRGVFSNPTGLLTPGLFTLMRIPSSGRYQAVLIPDSAVNTDQNERYLLLLGARQCRPAAVQSNWGRLFGTLRAIPSGLAPNEHVIVDGLQSARPGTKVAPQEAPISTQSLDALEKSNPPIPASQPATQPDSQTSAEARS